MKRLLVLSFIFLLFASFVIAQDAPADLVGEADAEKLGEAIDSSIPIDPDTGEIDFEKYKPLKSEAEVRIDKINAWIIDNLSWLTLVFGIIPSISWLFALNIYFMLLFFVILFLNGETLFSFFSESKAKWLGLLVFIILLVTKFYLALAKAVHHLAGVIWNVILPWGTAIAIILAVIVIFGAAASIPLAMRVFFAIEQWLAARKEAKAKAKTDLDREVLHAEAEAMEEK